MKKIILWILICLFSITPIICSAWLWQEEIFWWDSNEWESNENQGWGHWWNWTNWTAEANWVTQTPQTTQQQTETTPQHQCTLDSECTAKGQGMCITWDNNTRICIYNEYRDLWFNITTECLLNWQCWMNIYETAGIRKKDTTPSVKTFAQDVVLAATTFFGTVISIIFIVSGLMYVFSWFTGKSPDKAKKMMIWSIVWLLFVTLSYSIIRLIQFLATWWWGS